MVASRVTDWHHMRKRFETAVMGARERFEVSQPIEPDLIDKHTLYAVAWDIIRLPAQDGEQATHQTRVRIKRQCRAYAKALGWELVLTNRFNGEEQWALYRTGEQPLANGLGANSFFGTLEQCCLHLVERDIWPEGKPKDDSPTS